MSGKTGPTRLAIACALGLFAFLLYLPSLRSDFVYDAELQIKFDSYIHTSSHLADVLTLRVLGQDVLDGTRPAHLLFLMTDSLLWGRNPFGYHLTSNLFHAGNVALLFLLLARLGAMAAPGQPEARVRMAAAIGALLLAVHPVITEAISEVSFREDPLAAFFILAGLVLAGHFPGRNRSRTILCGTACILSLLLAAASKETGFVGPILLGLYAWLFRGKESGKSWIILVAAALLTVGAFAAARFGLEPAVSKIFAERPTYLGGSRAAVFAIQPLIWTLLLANTAWPAHLSVDYMPQNFAWISLPGAICALVFVLSLQLLPALRSRLALLGAAVFWLGLAPVSNFIPIFRPIADRFLYLPMAGLAMTVCACLLLARRRCLFGTCCTAAIALEIALVPLTIQREAVFANSLNLWRDTAEKSPFSPTAHDNLGWALSATGEREAALNSFARALNLSQGRLGDAWVGAAVTLDRMQRFADAEAAAQKAIACDPRYTRPNELVESVFLDQASADAFAKILDRMPASAKLPLP